MLRALSIGVVAGMRAFTPLAVIGQAARRGARPTDAPAAGASAIVGRPRVADVALALAAGELLGDKLPFAPDRTIAPGLAVRVATGAVAGAALAPRGRRRDAAIVAGVAAAAGSFVTLAARVAALRRIGRVRSGLLEDAIAIAAAVALVRGATADRRG